MNNRKLMCPRCSGKMRVTHRGFGIERFMCLKCGNVLDRIYDPEKFNEIAPPIILEIGK